MKNAIEYAKEILKTDDAIAKTKSEKAKRDLMKARKRKDGELRFYCKAKNISYGYVMERAKR